MVVVGTVLVDSLSVEKRARPNNPVATMVGKNPYLSHSDTLLP